MELKPGKPSKPHGYAQSDLHVLSCDRHERADMLAMLCEARFAAQRGERLFAMHPRSLAYKLVLERLAGLFMKLETGPGAGKIPLLISEHDRRVLHLAAVVCGTAEPPDSRNPVCERAVEELCLPPRENRLDASQPAGASDGSAADGFGLPFGELPIDLPPVRQAGGSAVTQGWE